jgi:hypothetical protein
MQSELVKCGCGGEAIIAHKVDDRADVWYVGCCKTCRTQTISCFKYEEAVSLWNLAMSRATTRPADTADMREMGLPWVAAPWGNGSSKEGFVNISSPTLELVIAEDVERSLAEFIVRCVNNRAYSARPSVITDAMVEAGANFLRKNPYQKAAIEAFCRRAGPANESSVISMCDDYAVERLDTFLYIHAAPLSKSILKAALPHAADDSAIREQVRREVVKECAKIADAAYISNDKYEAGSGVDCLAEKITASQIAQAIRALAAGKEG